MRTVPGALILLAIGLAVAGCASAPPATGNIARASTLVDQAARGGAQRYAAADINRARENLRLALFASQEGESVRAARLADRAAADAQLALARSESAEAERAAAEIERSVQTLRAETNRETSMKTSIPELETGT
jgi:hypothetical protein